MKYVSLLVFLLFLNFASAQKYSFQLYIKYPCDSIAKPANVVYDLLDPINYATYDIPVDSTQTFTYEPISLPGPGTYRIRSIELPDLKEIDIIIDKPGVTKYTLNLPKINMYAVGLEMFPEYRACNIVCNGYHEDKYSNGNIRIKGYFSNGSPFKLKEYYSNGILESELYKGLRKTHYAKYDSIGKIKQSHWSERGGSYLSYRNRGYTVYYPDESIQIKKSTINYIDRLQIFYPNGNLKIEQKKNKRIEYYENGKTKIFCKWKKITESNSFGSKKQLFNIYKSMYDEKGNVINTEERTENVSDNPQPSIAYTDKDSDYLEATPNPPAPPLQHSQ